jgi:hypothetical protein
MNSSRAVGIVLLVIGAVLLLIGWRGSSPPASTTLLVLGLVSGIAGVISLVAPETGRGRVGYGGGRV